MGTPMNTMPGVAEPDIWDPDLFDETIFEESVVPDRPWVVIVWDDPINLMSYVTFVFQKVFGFSKSKAEKHMKEVHNEGKSILYTGMKEHAEMYALQLQQAGLWATIQQDK